MKVHITGASGSGTTTLGQALAQALSSRHLDADAYFWLPTMPPYQEKRPQAERLVLLHADLQSAPDIVASGSVVGWGAEIEEAFDLIVFLYLPAITRIERLRQREITRYGFVNPEFLAWAAQYDEGPAEGRSLAKHEAWLAQRACPVLRLEQDISVQERLGQVLNAINHLPSRQSA
ncbi:AAA family ATPase [Methylophilus flavus]|uniref:AAA family ATPase n=1 Tax=Methylophilus flavus TaxID=640084 RepID=A0ABW3PB70_9PROT